jgi:hypothetical protein
VGDRKCFGESGSAGDERGYDVANLGLDSFRPARPCAFCMPLKMLAARAESSSNLETS